MTLPSSVLDLIREDGDTLLALVSKWAECNSFSYHVEGLEKMRHLLIEAFAPLADTVEEISLPPQTVIGERGEIKQLPLGKAIRFVKRPQARRSILLGGHMDTVYPPSSSSHKVRREGQRLIGPGVADMKGGLVVLLRALKALESTSVAEEMGWEVLINPDEEIGSTGSSSLWSQCASKHQAALLFEPAYPDGSVVSARKGSMNLCLVAKGKAAHAGRDFEKGRNAIVGLSQLVERVADLSDVSRGITVNIGTIYGGEGANVVPEHALAVLNIRTWSPEGESKLLEELEGLVKKFSCSGVSFELHTLSKRPPKQFDPSSQKLYAEVQACAKKLQIPYTWQESGGATDGNFLVTEGLPTLDAAGVIGGNLHSDEEYLEIESLVTRTQLITLFLMQFAARTGEGDLL